MPASLTPEEQLRLIEELERGTPAAVKSVAPAQDVTGILPAQDFMPSDRVPEDLLTPIDIPKAKAKPDYSVSPVTTQGAVSIPAEEPAPLTYDDYFAANPYLTSLDEDTLAQYQRFYTPEGERANLLGDEQQAAIDAYNAALGDQAYTYERKGAEAPAGIDELFDEEAFTEKYKAENPEARGKQVKDAVGQAKADAYNRNLSGLSAEQLAAYDEAIAERDTLAAERKQLDRTLSGAEERYARMTDNVPEVAENIDILGVRTADLGNYRTNDYSGYEYQQAIRAASELPKAEQQAFLDNWKGEKKLQETARVEKLQNKYGDLYDSSIAAARAAGLEDFSLDWHQLDDRSEGAVSKQIYAQMLAQVPAGTSAEQINAMRKAAGFSGDDSPIILSQPIPEEHIQAAVSAFERIPENAAYEDIAAALSSYLPQGYTLELNPSLKVNSNLRSNYGVDLTDEEYQLYNAIAKGIVLDTVQQMPEARYEQAVQRALLRSPAMAVLNASFGVDPYRQTEDGSMYVLDPITGQQLRTKEVKDERIAVSIGKAIPTIVTAAVAGPAAAATIAPAATAAVAAGTATLAQAATVGLITAGVNAGIQAVANPNFKFDVKDFAIDAVTAGAANYATTTANAAKEAAKQAEMLNSLSNVTAAEQAIAAAKVAETASAAKMAKTINTSIDVAKLVADENYVGAVLTGLDELYDGGTSQFVFDKMQQAGIIPPTINPATQKAIQTSLSVAKDVSAEKYYDAVGTVLNNYYVNPQTASDDGVTGAIEKKLSEYAGGKGELIGLNIDDLAVGMSKIAEKALSGEDPAEAFLAGVAEYVRAGGSLGDYGEAARDFIEDVAGDFYDEIISPAWSAVRTVGSAAEDAIREVGSTIDDVVIQPVREGLKDIDLPDMPDMPDTPEAIKAIEDAARTAGSATEDVVREVGSTVDDVVVQPVREALKDIDIPDGPDINLPDINLPDGPDINLPDIKGPNLSGLDDLLAALLSLGGGGGRLVSGQQMPAQVDDDYEKVNIGYLYDFSSIFANPEQEAKFGRPRSSSGRRDLTQELLDILQA